MGVELTAAVVRYRKLSFNYVLFERKSRFYEYNALGSVESSSKCTVESIEGVVRSRLEIPSGLKVEVCVYTVCTKTSPFDMMFTIRSLRKHFRQPTINMSMI